MLDVPSAFAVKNLPDSIPLYAVEKDLLLPGGQVKFEAKDKTTIQMVQDALAAKDRMIGVVLIKHKAKFNHPKLYNIGCAGRITAFEELLGFRYSVTLTGYCRFSIEEEIATIRGYRRAKVDWSGYEAGMEIDPNPEVDRLELIRLLKLYLQYIEIDMDWMAVESTPNYSLITFFAMSLPLDTAEKQALLECPTMEDTGALLIDTVKRKLKALEGKG